MTRAETPDDVVLVYTTAASLVEAAAIGVPAGDAGCLAWLRAETGSGDRAEVAR